MLIYSSRRITRGHCTVRTHTYFHFKDPSTLSGGASVALVVAVPRHESLQFVVLSGELEEPVDDLRLAGVQQR